MKHVLLVLIIAFGIPYAVIFGRFLIALVVGLWVKILQTIGFTFNEKRVDALLERIAPNIED